MTKKAKTSAAADSATDIPHVGGPRVRAHPDDMATRARLFGTTPPAVESARILEIGCSDGANLISIAASLPDSVCVGIDPSASQIANGEKVVKGAKLKNVFLAELAFQDLPDKPEEPYDFIIAHGVYSWIDADSQAVLIEKIKSHLAPNGVAYVSYNCYPGWHLRQIVREFMLFHTAGIEDPAEQVAKCRAALPGLMQSIAPDLQGYAALIAGEHNNLSQSSDSEILREFLTKDNLPCYFHEFASRLAESDMQFLCESDLNSMQANRYPAALANLASPSSEEKTSKDAVQAEQYLDFARLRMFRESLICHSDATVDRGLSIDRVHDLSATAFGLYRENMGPVDAQPVTFRGTKGAEITTAHPLAKAAMRVLAEQWPSRVPFSELVKSAQAMLAASTAGAIPKEEIDLAESAVAEILLAGAAAAIVDLHSAPARFITSISEKPVASPLARWQANKGTMVFTLRHQSLNLNTLGQQIILLLDGKHDHQQLADAVVKLVEDDTIVLQENGITVTDADARARLATRQVNAMLEDFSRSALLVG